MSESGRGGQVGAMLTELAVALREHGVRGHVYIVGRRAVAFAVRRNPATQRVENIGRDPGTFEAAIKKIGRKYAAGPDWLDDMAANVRTSPPARAPTLFDTPELVVTGASAAHALAACLEAGSGSNAEDVFLLARRLGLTDSAEAVAIHRRAYPGSKLSAAATAAIDDAMACLRPAGRKAGSREPQNADLAPDASTPARP